MLATHVFLSTTRLGLVPAGLLSSGSLSALPLAELRTVGQSGCDYTEIQPAINELASLPGSIEKVIHVSNDKLYSGSELAI